MTELSFDTLPPALPAYRRLVMSRPSRDVRLAEPLVAQASAVRADPGKLRAYGRVCGVEDSSQFPICYPQAMAYPLHLRLLGEPAFPLAAMGLVHLENRIAQSRRLDPAELFDVRVTIAEIEDLERGYEFELVTELIDTNGQTPWRGAARILSRRPAGAGGSKPKKKREATPCEWPELAEFTVGANMGRRYARVSGDFNPIHLTALSAKLLGFKRAIVHGMWTLARSAAALPVDSSQACTLDVAFKTPLFLPGRARLHGIQAEGGFDFEVRNIPDHRPILAGRIAA